MGSKLIVPKWSRFPCLKIGWVKFPFQGPRDPTFVTKGSPKPTEGQSIELPTKGSGLKLELLYVN